jgi:hypothetical protein
MPAAPRKPQDHKAKAEAQGADISFQYEGETYTIKRANADNLELMEFVEDDLVFKALRGYLGLDQWNKWKDSVRTEDGRVPAATLEPFADAVMAAIGGGPVEAPNSAASPTS